MPDFGVRVRFLFTNELAAEAFCLAYAEAKDALERDPFNEQLQRIVEHMETARRGIGTGSAGSQDASRYEHGGS